MKNFAIKILYFSFLLLPSELFAQSGSTEGNTPVICDAFAAYCGLDVENDIKSGNPNVVNNCIAKISELYQGSKEEQDLARKLTHDCEEDLSSDLLGAGAKGAEGTDESDKAIDDIKGADRTTSLDEMNVTNKLIKKISTSVDSLLRIYSATMTMEGLKAYFAAIENNQIISAKSEASSEVSASSETEGGNK